MPPTATKLVLDLSQQCLFNRCSLLKQVAIFETGNITPVNIFASTSSVTTKNYVILMLHFRLLAKFNHDLFTHSVIGCKQLLTG